jgi:hypothetical protein
MKPRRYKCRECPYRGAADAKLTQARAEGAQAEPFPCHVDDTYGDHGIQCRGQFDAIQAVKEAA